MPLMMCVMQQILFGGGKVNKLLFALVLLIVLVTPLQSRDTEYQPVVIDDGVYVGTGLPQWGTLCADTGVYGDPYGLGQPYQYLQAGAKVSLHELARGVDGWVSIGPAQWVPLSALCDW